MIDAGTKLKTAIRTAVAANTELVKIPLDIAYQLAGMIEPRERVKPVQSNDNPGITWWYKCGVCMTPVDVKDVYCRHCGKELIW